MISFDEQKSVDLVESNSSVFFYDNCSLCFVLEIFAYLKSLIYFPIF